MSMADSIFTKIIEREIPADIVFENEEVIAFVDIAPVNKGHVLVVPKRPFENLFDGDEEMLCAMIVAAKNLAPVVRDAVGADGVTLVMNNGSDVGQEVMHAHLHIVPRFKNDGSFSTVKCGCYDENEASVLATQISAALSDEA